MPACLGGHRPSFLGPPQRLHAAGQGQLGVGDDFGQLAQRNVDAVQQFGQLGAPPVGDFFQLGRMRPA